ncbi:MAG: LLM class F420-dependent oxidoreductase [Acidimicrobiia bacterium]|jgi:probable F420-dependent oxidoreductase
MRIELGKYGIWQRSSNATPETARVVEELGFGALWLGGSPEGGLMEIERVIEATEYLPVATGIVNMWRDESAVVAASYHRINGRFPDRFLLGVGIGHPEATREYEKPYDTMVRYLGELSAAGVPREHLALAALGPRALKLAAERTAGAHPYLTTPSHTRFAREVMGDGVLLAPGHAVVVGEPAEIADEIARSFVARYLQLVNYRNNLLREGWSEEDLAGGGSDRLVAALVLSGDIEEVAGDLRAHVEAGADHVAIQALGPDPVRSYHELAEALL